VGRQAALGVCLALLLVPTAIAADGLPHKKLTNADQAAARTASLTIADVGGTWISQRSGATGDWKPRCRYVYEPDLSDLVETGEYASPEFVSRKGFSASSTTQVFRTIQMARAAHERAAVPGLPICLGEQIRNGGGGPGAAVTARGPLRFPKYGDRLNAYRVNVNFTAKDLTTTRVVADLVLVTRGRTGVAMIFAGSGQPLPTSLERLLVRRVVARAI
jgi:hypothetical protein